MRVLLVDNHDSYTFNLAQLMGGVYGVAPVVVRNDERVLVEPGFVGGFDAVVVSPGPGRPGRRGDLGFVPDVLAGWRGPVLGVCLGHQALAELGGGRVVAAPEARHGYLSQVRHDGRGLFRGVPQGFTAVRYHSLCVAEPLPEALEAVAWAEDGVLMGLRHRQLPWFGVQFHPESVASEYGRELLGNFGELARPGAVAVTVGGGVAREPERRGESGVGGWGVEWVELPGAVDTERAFRELFAGAGVSFWLDSSRVGEGSGRFSFLGDASGPLSEGLRYRVGEGCVSVSDRDGVRDEAGDVFALLERRLAERRVSAPELPFDFTGGYVGYFGYEVKADCGGARAHRAATDDAVWVFADRMVAVDHREGRTYALAVCRRDDESSVLGAKAWVEETARTLAGVGGELEAGEGEGEGEGAGAGVGAAGEVGVERWLVRDADGYRGDVDECRRQLLAGESYEICLTNRVRVPLPEDDGGGDGELAYYGRLRRLNPAPYAAFLRDGEAGTTVFCSSPERFLRVARDGWAESSPIKGTAPRDLGDPAHDAALADELAAGAKTRAENLMIVDLVRNDLGRVCATGTVAVERFMAVESYATVHQLVSTVRGRLAPGRTAMDAVRACFPGGSMTGAPKERTMEIIDRLEPEARGVYSGALGYFGLSGGADLNIVIRTAVGHGGWLTVGAGGAIVLGSEREEEYREMLLKAAAPLRAWR